MELSVGFCCICRLKHYDGEVALATNMALLHMCAPEDLHVKEKFCLRKEVCERPWGELRWTLDHILSLCSLV